MPNITTAADASRAFDRVHQEAIVRGALLRGQRCHAADQRAGALRTDPLRRQIQANTLKRAMLTELCFQLRGLK